MIIITPIMLKRVFTSRIFLVIETFCLTVLPLLLLKFFPDLIHSRTRIFFAGLTYIALFVWSQKISRRNFGLQFKNFFPAVKAILKPTLLAIGVIYVLFYFWRPLVTIPLLIQEVKLLPSSLVLILKYLFISVPLQEILFRAYLINRVGLVFPNKSFVRLYSTVIFMFIHTPINNFFLTLGTLILGWLWAGNFLKFKNIFSVIISHTLIGLVYLFLMVYR